MLDSASNGNRPVAVERGGVRQAESMGGSPTGDPPERRTSVTAASDVHALSMAASHTAVNKVAFLGNYVPRQCGIATFTRDVTTAVSREFPATECFVVPVNDPESRYDYPSEVRFEFEEQELDSYHRAADFLNFANVDVVCLQHEYGIFGGTAGSHILALLRDLRMPIVTTLHTVLNEPNRDQRRVMRQLVDLSSRLVVMSGRAQEFLEQIYHVPTEKIRLVPHGIPDMPFVDPHFYKDQLGVEGRLVALTFGLLSPNKGIEFALQALPRVVKEFPDLMYIVLGATHPSLLRNQGEAYRFALERLVRELGLQQNVLFYDRFVELNELLEFLGAADLYVTPYLSPAQVVSGTLAYAFGCGKAVISTPYWHAEELLANGRGSLVPFRDADALAEAMLELLRDENRRHAMRKQAYLLGRDMIWSRVAREYMAAFVEARQSRSLSPSRAARISFIERPMRPLKLRLDHLQRLTDTTGLVQHALHTVPNYSEGYSTDDNARALLLTVLLEELGTDSPLVERLATTYAAFLQQAFDGTSGHFRNFLGFDRRWLPETPSEDTHGRSLWALGACVGRGRRRGLQGWAAQLFEQALPACARMAYPRGWAFALLGIHEYLLRFHGDRLVHQLREELVGRLLNQFEQVATDDWPWCEEIVTYCNARIPQALIVSGRCCGDDRALDTGFRALRWLVDTQRSDTGHFRPVGCHGFSPRGGTPAEFDQQPIEAQAMISACIEAYRTTLDEGWLTEARDIFAWFFGRNHLGLMVCDAATGGCYDGLQQDRLNQNQGAESTLAYLLAQTEMTLLENSLAAFRRPEDLEPGVSSSREDNLSTEITP